MKNGAARLVMFAALWLASHSALGDWAFATDPWAVRPSPDGSDVIAQNPPSFTWSRHASMPVQYEVELIAPDGQRSLVSVNRNWYLPDHLMAVGNWGWRVRPRGSAAWSDLRRFTLGPDARPFVVPAAPVLKARVQQRARPRSLPALAGGLATLASLATAQRPDALARLQEQVRKQMLLPSVSDADYTLDTTGRLDSGKVAQIRKLYGRVTEICQQAESAALLYVLTREVIYLSEARRRANELAALDPTGPTSYKQDDQTARRVAMSLALIADQLNDHLSPAERALWWRVVGVRTQSIYTDLDRNNGQLEQYPFDSHASVALGYLAALASLSLGEIPEAERWFDYAVRYHFHYVWPWAGSEGGYANGTAYAQYAVHDALRVWQILHNATGVNLFAKPWSEGLVNYFAWFVPPGAPTHMFGDDAESKPVPWLLKAFASRVRTPVAKWYVRNLIGDEDAFLKLQAPYPMPVDEVPTWQAPPSAAWMRSIGWVAMHSDIADRGRTSVYFKSSQFGSQSHSHADQNSFVVNVAGRPLLTDSGVYDWHGSPHWTGWYRRTVAHNAITFDGGQGQVSAGTNETSAAAVGRVLSARLTPSPYRVDGDATQAYAGALSMARRTLWFSPNEGWILIRDQLAAPAAHRFELNLHAAGPFTPTDAGYRIYDNDVSACIDLLSPEVFANGVIAADYPVIPQGERIKASYSLQLPTKRASTSADLWIGIRIGCVGAPLTLTRSDGNRARLSDGKLFVELQ